jgi:hypothetical protein
LGCVEVEFPQFSFLVSSWRVGKKPLKRKEEPLPEFESTSPSTLSIGLYD